MEKPKKIPGIDIVHIVGYDSIIIGQACECDHSGAQACKAFRREVIRLSCQFKPRGHYAGRTDIEL